MAFIDMNTNQFYQPLKAVGTRKDRQPAAFSLRPTTVHAKSNDPTALRPSKKGSKILQDYDLIESLDMSATLPKEPLDPFHMPAPNLNGTKTDAGGTIPHHRLIRW